MTSTFMLLSHTIVLACDREAFDTLLAGLQDAVRPQGPLEQFAFERLVTAAWNIRRAQSAESSLLAKSQGEDPLLHPDTAADARRFSTLVRQWESSYNRAQKELADLQTSRALRDLDQDLPPLARIERLARFVEQTQSNTLQRFHIQWKALDVETKQWFKDHRDESLAKIAAAKQTQSAPAAPAPKAQVQCCEHSAKRTQFTPITVPKPMKLPPKIGRNDPCPCGSGQKYKRCCGSVAHLTSAQSA